MNQSIKKMTLDGMDPARINLGLDRMRQLMARLGDPHEHLRSLHLAGTNGKGSTAAFIARVLKEGGYKTGLYTSPHLEKFNERIRISGTMISDEDVETLSAEIKAAALALPAGEPTYFEFATALAFLYFSRKKVDIALIETGLGGRLDATNILTPLLSVITPVALDHADYLGNDITLIAAEKGGIIKKGVPLIMGRQEEKVWEVLRKVALDRGSQAFRLGVDFDCLTSGKGMFDYRGIKCDVRGVEPSLYGAHQMENAALALAALEVLDRRHYNIDDYSLKKGIKETFWPGRFETVSQNPHIILDGAHNPAGAGRLAEALNERFKGSKGVLVAGFMDDKDYCGMLEKLAPFASHIILTKPDQKRALSPEKGLSNAKKIAPHSPVEVIFPVKEAVNEGVKLAKDKQFIIITGSLYGVGEARGELKKRGFLERDGL